MFEGNLDGRIVMDSKDTEAATSAAGPERVVSLAGVQNIALVQSLYTQLSGVLESDDPISLDVSQTERLDTAVAQLLLSFTQAAREKNQDVSWQQPSDEFLNAVKLLGLTEQLGIAA